MRSLAAAAVLAVGLAGPAQAVGEFTVEGWNGLALFTDGKLLQCQMTLSAINNFDMVLSLDPAGELRLGLRSQTIDVGWTMIFQQRIALRIQVDDGPVLTRAFIAKAPTAISTSLSGTDWDKRLPEGKLFRVNTGGRVKLFHLNGIKEAMGKLKSCVAKNGRA